MRRIYLPDSDFCRRPSDTWTIYTLHTRIPYLFKHGLRTIEYEHPNRGLRTIKIDSENHFTINDVSITLGAINGWYKYIEYEADFVDDDRLMYDYLYYDCPLMWDLPSGEDL